MYILLSWLSPLRAICMAIDGVAYSLLDNAYNIVINLSTAELLNHSTIKSLMSNLYVLVGVVAFFRLALLLVNSIIDPEKLNEKGKGLSSIFFRVVGMIILLIVTPILFEKSYELQGKIVGADTGKNIIFKTILGDNANIGSSEEGNAGSVLQNIALSSLITIDKNYLVNKGAQCDIDKEDPNHDTCGFYPLTCVSNGDGTCTPQGGYVYDENKCNWANCQNAVDVYNKMYVSEDMSPAKLAGYVGVSEKININDDDSDEKQEVYVYNYMLIVTGVVGIGMTLVILSFAIDIAVRMFELVALEILSPLFIATFVDPKSAQSGPFKNWLTAVGQSYATLYIRLAILALMVLLVSIINQSKIFQSMGDVAGPAKIFMIIGLLIFAKKSPKWISDMIGIKGNGMGLWTPKKLRENMAFGNTISKGARAAAGIGLGAAAGIHAARKANRLNRAANGETVHSRAKQAAKNKKGQGFKKQAGAYLGSMFSKDGAKENWNNMIKGKKANAQAGFGAMLSGAKSGAENGWKADNLKDMQGKIKANADATLNTYAPGYKKPSQRASEKIDKFAHRQMDNVLGDSTTRGKREKDLKDRNTAETNGMLVTGADGKRNKVMSPVDASEVKSLCNGGIKTTDGKAIEFSSTNENGISQALIASRATDVKFDSNGNVTCKLGKDDLVMDLKSGKIDVTRDGKTTTKDASDYAVEGDKIMNANGKMAMESIARENAIEKIVAVNNNEQAIAQANQNMLSANSQIIELKANVEANFGKDAEKIFSALEGKFDELNANQLAYEKAMKKRSELNPEDPDYQEKLNSVIAEIADARQDVEAMSTTADAIKQQLSQEVGASQAEVIFSALTSKNNNILQVQRISTETAELKSEINTDLENYGENSYYAPENNDKSGHVNYAAEPGKVEEIIDLMKTKKQKVDDRYKKATETKSE